MIALTVVVALGLAFVPDAAAGDKPAETTSITNKDANGYDLLLGSDSKCKSGTPSSIGPSKTKKIPTGWLCIGTKKKVPWEIRPGKRYRITQSEVYPL
jgi:hypothetical protein